MNTYLFLKLNNCQEKRFPSPETQGTGQRCKTMLKIGSACLVVTRCSELHMDLIGILFCHYISLFFSNCCVF